MKIGAIEVLPIEYGRFKLDGGAMFGVVPRVLWERVAPADENNQIRMALRGLLVLTPDRLVLVDTGVGRKMPEKLNKIYAVDFSQFELERSLQKLGLNKSDVTDVILTHLHFDHTGGATEKNAAGEIVPAFPNATYHVQKKQFEWALNPSERDRASYFPENYVPLREQGKLNLLDGNAKILPGVEVLEVNGHTPGQQLVKISNEKNTLLYCGDLIPTSAHIPLPWIMSYDLFPLTTLDEKKKLLPRAVEENWILFYEHDPDVVASFVIQDEKGFRKGQEVTFDHA